MNPKRFKLGAVILAVGILLTAPFAASAATTTESDAGYSSTQLQTRSQGTAVIANPQTVEQVVGHGKTGFTSDVSDLPTNYDYNLTGPLPSKNLNGDTINVGDLFLYQYDSSTSGTADDWSMTTKLDTKHDEFTGHWAVYEMEDGKMMRSLASDSYPKTQAVLLGIKESSYKPLFTASSKDGAVVISATPEYKKWLKNHTPGITLRVYLQCKRIASGDKITNTSTESLGKEAKISSNMVTTSTPDRSMGIAITEKSGKVTVTNTSKGEDDGALIQAKDLTFTNFSNIAYPEGWDSLDLKPGQGITLDGIVEDALKPVSVSAIPVGKCVAWNTDPFDPYFELFDFVYGKGPFGSLYDTDYEVDGGTVYLSDIYFPEEGNYEKKSDDEWVLKEESNKGGITIDSVQLCRADAVTASAPTPQSDTPSPSPDSPSPSEAPSPSPSVEQAKLADKKQSKQVGKERLASTGACVGGAIVAACVFMVASAVSLCALRGARAPQSARHSA